MIDPTFITTFLGGFTGLLGTVWSSYNNRKLKALDLEDNKAQRSHEVVMVKAESEAMMAEAEANIKVTTAQIAGEIEMAEVKAFTESQKSGRTKIFDAGFMEKLFEVEGWLKFFSIPCGVLLAMLFGFADFFKDIARPGITAYLLGISTWITFKAWQLMDKVDGAAMTPALAAGIVTDVIHIVLYLTVTSVTWWFGDRMASKGLAKNLKLRSA